MGRIFTFSTSHESIFPRARQQGHTTLAMYVQQPGVLVSKSFYLRITNSHGGQLVLVGPGISLRFIARPSEQAVAHTLGRWWQVVNCFG